MTRNDFGDRWTPRDACEAAQALALLADEGLLDGPAAAELEAHLRGCASCVDERSALRGVGEAVGVAFRGVPLMADVAPAVAAAMAAAEGTGSSSAEPSAVAPTRAAATAVPPPGRIAEPATASVGSPPGSPASGTTASAVPSAGRAAEPATVSAGSPPSRTTGPRGIVTSRPARLVRRWPWIVAAASAAALLLVVNAVRPGFSGFRPWEKPAPETVDPTSPPPAGAFDLVPADPAAAGIDFVHHGPVRAPKWIFEAVGSGAAAADLDGDGLPELVFADAWPLDAARPAGAGHRLYANLGNRRFRDATEGSGIDVPEPVTGVLAADLDGDGRRDLVFCGYGHLRVLRNMGGLRFRDVTGEAGLPEEPGSWFTCVVAADFDGDGVLDLYVTRYADLESYRRLLKGLGGNPGSEADWRGIPVFAGPEPLQPQADRMLRGLGGMRFEDVTAAALPGLEPRFGFQAVATDADGDGRVDIYVANDAQANFLWHNEGGGRFREVALSSGAAFDASGKAQAGMGVAVGDTHGDGLPDLLVTNFSHDHLTYYAYFKGDGSPGRPLFDDRSYPSGVGPASARHLAWGCLFTDLDLDGEEDLLVANGHLYPRVGETGGGEVTYEEPMQGFRGGGGRFTEVPVAGTPRVHRGLVRADLDGDGAQDFVATVLGGPPALWFGGVPAGRRWIGFRLRGTTSPRDPAGARVALVSAGRPQTRELHLGDSFAGSSEPVLPFGLGAAETAQRVVVRWPSGRTESFGDRAAGKVHELVEGEGAK